MRNILTICLLGCLLLGACNFNRNDISIVTSDNENQLNFSANYPENRTAKAQLYVEKMFNEDRIFKSVSDVKTVEIKLVDGTRFQLSYEPGKVVIDFDRDKNSFASYKRMKAMIAGFGNAIKD